MPGSGPSTDQKPTDEVKDWDAKAAVFAAYDALKKDAGQDDEDDDQESSDLDEELDEELLEDDDDSDDTEEGDDDEGDESEDDEDADETAEDQDEEPETERDVGFAKSKRFRQMNEQLKAAKSKAEKLDAVEQVLASVGISVDSLDEGLAVVKALKNPGAPGAMEVLAPHLEGIADVSGKGKLDEDLQAAVENSDLSETYARQIQAQRVREKLRDQAEREQSVRSTVERAAEALGGLYREFEKSDPSFAVKKAFVEDRANVLVAAFRAKNGGRPPSIEEGLQLVRIAKQHVDERMPAAKKERRPESRVVSGGGTGKAAKRDGGSKPREINGRDDLVALFKDTLRQNRR